MTSQPYSKKISFEIVKKGRKFFKIRYSPEHNEFQLLINDLTKDFQVGQTVTDLLCEFETQINSYTGGKKTTAIAVGAEDFAKRAEAQAKAEREYQIKKWRGYVEDNLDSGQVYTKGLDTLKSLGFDISIYADRIAQAQEAERQYQIKRWSGFVEAAALEGRVYAQGLSKLRELGASEIADQFRKQVAEVRAEKAKEEQTKIAKQAEQEAAAGIVDYHFASPGWTRWDEQTHLQVGDLYLGRDGQHYKILTRKRTYYREDGLSFGLSDDSGEIVFGKARLATADEAAPLVAAAEAGRIQALIPKENEVPAVAVEQSTPESQHQPVGIDHYSLADRICDAINDSSDFRATLWDKKESETRVYVTTTCRKRKDCGYVRVCSSGEIYRHLNRQAGTIEALYSSDLQKAALDHKRGFNVDHEVVFEAYKAGYLSMSDAMNSDF